MQRDPRLENLPETFVNVISELMDAGVTAEAVAAELAIGLTTFIKRHLPCRDGAALFRDHADALVMMARADAPQLEPSACELLGLRDRAEGFIRGLEAEGVRESDAITALNNACVMRVAKSRGAAGATVWLRRMADHAEANARSIDQVAKAA
jgi:hypothetical protein